MASSKRRWPSPTTRAKRQAELCARVRRVERLPARTTGDFFLGLRETLDVMGEVLRLWGIEPEREEVSPEYLRRGSASTISSATCLLASRRQFIYRANSHQIFLRPCTPLISAACCRRQLPLRPQSLRAYPGRTSASSTPWPVTIWSSGCRELFHMVARNPPEVVPVPSRSVTAQSSP